jgi:hypothetical protein
MFRRRSRRWTSHDSISLAGASELMMKVLKAAGVGRGIGTARHVLCCMRTHRELRSALAVKREAQLGWRV